MEVSTFARLLASGLTIALVATCADDTAVQWGPLLRQSGLFLGIQHGFRLATEPGTRAGMRGPFFRGWYEAVTSLHGWSDGDPFLVNYIGHPMQGAVTSYLWIQNDPSYRTAQFGRSPRYWKSRLRAAGYAWAYSTQFELGPVSEASLGKVQNFHPQQGFVDHIVTPSAGMLWTVGEDAIDRQIIQRLETRFENMWARAFLRAGLNPSRSFANALRFKVPWHRDDRGWRSNFRPPKSVDPDQYVAPSSLGPTFELATVTTYSRFSGSANTSTHCIGATASAGFRLSQNVHLVGRGDGCKLFFTPNRISGDAVSFVVGPKLILRANLRLRPYVASLAGVQRITVDEASASGALVPQNQDRSWSPPPPSRSSPAATTYQTGGFTMSYNAGADLSLTRSLALRVAEFDYAHTWLPSADIPGYTGVLRVSIGLVVRIGTW